MSSANPYEIIDDEGFDWEAAAREMDVACQVTKPSTSFVGKTPNFAEEGSKNKKKSGTSRQFTIHKFLGKKEIPRPQFEVSKIGKNDRDCFVEDEGVSCIDIDAEAAKTWIYPGSDEIGFLLFLQLNLFGFICFFG